MSDVWLITRPANMYTVSTGYLKWKGEAEESWTGDIMLAMMFKTGAEAKDCIDKCLYPGIVMPCSLTYEKLHSTNYVSEVEDELKYWSSSWSSASGWQMF